MLRTLGNNGVRYWTGRLRNGKQVIIGPSLPNILVYLFDSDGKFFDRRVVQLSPKPRQNKYTNNYIIDASFLFAMEAQIVSIQEDMGFMPQTIEIQQFYDDEEDVGIKELPSEFEVFLADPDSYSAEDRNSLEMAVQEWYEKQRFVFVWGDELWISKDGENLSS